MKPGFEDNFIVADSKILLCLQESNDSSFFSCLCFNNPNPLKTNKCPWIIGMKEEKESLTDSNTKGKEH